VSTPLPPHLVKEAQSVGAEQALRDLGILPPEEGHEKVAVGGILAGIGRGLVSGAGRLLFGRGAQAAGGATKGILSRAMGGIERASRFAGKPFQGMGEGVMQFAKDRGVSAANLARLQRFGKGLPTHMGGFGLAGGVTSAATAQPGEDRFKAFLKGFGGGALMGGVMGGAGNLYRMGMGRVAPGLGRAAAGVTGKGSVLRSPALNPSMPLTNIRAAGTPWKQWGAKAALGGGAFLAGDVALAPFGMSITKGLYDIAKGQPQQQPLYRYPQIYTAPAIALGQRYGRGAMMGLAPGYGTSMISPWQQQQYMGQ
jgi:hypothetical protein